jgi:hypothetical protein
MIKFFGEHRNHYSLTKAILRKALDFPSIHSSGYQRSIHEFSAEVQDALDDAFERGRIAERLNPVKE